MDMSKGAKMALGLLGITPEMLANPALLLKQFGINPDDILKKAGEFEQIGLSLVAAINNVNARLARIEAHLGIESGGLGGGIDDGAGGHLGDVGKLPPNRRN